MVSALRYTISIMIFRTEISPRPSEFQISHSQYGLTIGSCFSDSIGSHLENAKFTLLRNPLGVVYNPISIHNALQILCGKRTLSEHDLFEQHSVWKSYLLHSSFASINKNEVLERCATVQQSFSSKFQTLDYCIITLGTAWIYELKSTGEVVNNCHKTAACNFNRKQLSVAEILQSLTQTVELLQSINRHIHIIFTISPVRHWSDGAHGNQVSKSLLFVALNELQKLNNRIHYFEAYELLMDDLRDYRFYESDLLHPNSQAVSYIWQQFAASYFSADTQEIIQQIRSVHKAMKHRPFQAQSKEYQTFCAKQYALCQSIAQHFPLMDLQREMQFFSAAKENLPTAI